MQTGRIKIVLYVDGHWAYNYPTMDLKKHLGESAWSALRGAFDRLEPLKHVAPIKAEAYPEQHDDPD